MFLVLGSYLLLTSVAGAKFMLHGRAMAPVTRLLGEGTARLLYGILGFFLLVASVIWLERE